MRLMKIELYFDFSCPFAYIASTRIEAIAAEAGAELLWRPMLLGGVFQGTGLGNSSPMEQMAPTKARHNRLDMHRWADAFGVPLHMPDSHPMRTVRALRALLSLPEAEWPGVIHAIYRAYWQDGRDITSASVIREVLAGAGVHGSALERAVAANDDPALKDELRARTDEAVSREVFGAPTVFVHVPDQRHPYMFWGQDRLHFVRAVLHGWRPGKGAPGSTARFAQLDQASANQAPAPTRPRLHFWFDFSSPFSYLAATQVERVAAAAGAELVWRPMLLGAVLKEIGAPSVPLFAMPEAKREYMKQDLQDCASYWNVPFVYATRFPQKTVTPLRLALLAGDRMIELSHALFRVMWVDDGDLENDATLERVLREHGFDAQDMLQRTHAPAAKQALIDSTAEALRMGVFGAPTMVVEDEHGSRLFWGQDRLELALAALRGVRSRADDSR